MTQYELPRTDDGEINLEYLSLALEDAFCSGDKESIKWAREVLRGIVANARAEEREACANECEATDFTFPNANRSLAASYVKLSKQAAKVCADIIRARGDSQ